MILLRISLLVSLAVGSAIADTPRAPLLRPRYDAAAAEVFRPRGDEYETQHIISAEPKNLVGDTKVFWSFDLSVMPPLWIQVPATCRAVGQHCYVFVADDHWNVNMDADDVQEVLYRFETSTLGSPEEGILDIDTGVFGRPPNELDEDPRIYIFYSALGSYGTSVFDEELSPGSYTVNWNAADLASCVYVATLDASNTTATNRLLLLK
ncbi:MAG: hypothetical protein CME06_07285 [Gemmatimonadetes bacterium]|nr:hypothetical protein [Gemmatimonadota bacterium]